MSQPSYLQQIAQRNSGSFSQLMPPRSLFQNWETPVPLEISDESPSVSTPIARSPAFPVPPAPQTTSLAEPPIQPQDAMLVTPPRLDLPKTSQAERSPEIPPATTIPKESLANPPIQLESKTLEPSFTILSPTDPVIPNPERVTLGTSANTETTEPRNSSSLRSENLTAIVPRASQPPERGLFTEQKPDVTENTSPPPQRTIAAVPSIVEFNNPLIEGGDRAQSPTENRPPTASPPPGALVNSDSAG
ncbi:MAG: hypothetical protein HC942_02015 [Microcoleus sp. SU_5_6]|nr:hypothetical protein [Microcoleus sp. SU_5_6]